MIRQTKTNNWVYGLILFIGVLLCAVVVTLLIQKAGKLWRATVVTDSRPPPSPSAVRTHAITETAPEDKITNDTEKQSDKPDPEPSFAEIWAQVADKIPLANRKEISAPRMTKKPQSDDNTNAQIKTDNLLNNASFEQNPFSTEPTVWQTVSLGPGNTAEWSSERAASGHYALKIAARQPTHRGWPGWTSRLQHRAGHGYRLQASIFTPDGANAWLELVFYDRNNRYLTGFSSGCSRRKPLQNQWIAKHHQIKAEYIPEEATYLQIGLRQCLTFTKGRMTHLYYDDVSLQYLNAQ